MARALVTAMADGNATEMAAAMVDRDRNSNGRRQWRRRWAIAMVAVMATATESAMAMEMAMAMAMAMATARAPITRKGCLFMWQRCAALLEGQHLASTPMDTKENAFTSAASWG